MSRLRSLTRPVLLVLLGVLSLGLAVVALQYLRWDPSTFFEPQRLTYLGHRTALTAHVLGASLALLVLAPQLSPGLRARRPGVHRVVGRLYVGGVAVGAAGGLALSAVAHGGPVARLGFGGLAVAWLTTTTLAVLAIRRRDVATHRRWMVRSAALTGAALTLRLELGVVAAAGIGPLDPRFATAYAAIAWLSWVPNLGVAWWWTSRRGRTPGRLDRGSPLPGEQEASRVPVG